MISGSAVRGAVTAIVATALATSGCTMHRYDLVGESVAEVVDRDRPDWVRVQTDTDEIQLYQPSVEGDSLVGRRVRDLDMAATVGMTALVAAVLMYMTYVIQPET